MSTGKAEKELEVVRMSSRDANGEMQCGGRRGGFAVKTGFKFPRC